VFDQLSDTDPEAARVQIALLRAAGPARRLQIALSLSETTMMLAREGIRQALGPGATDEQVALRFVELHYGRELAGGVRQRLESGR
jgi:hypothetical protein